MPTGIYQRGENSKHSNSRGDPLTQFLKRVNKRGPVHPVCGQCWTWTGCISPGGYGKFRGGEVAHRFSYRSHFGDIPAGLLVMHKCDNPSCVNPDHLFVGTPDDNMQDKVAKNRQSHVGSSKNPPKGTRNTKAKLTDDQVRGIRRLSAEGYSVKYIILVLNLPIDQVNVRRITSGNGWRHIQ